MNCLVKFLIGRRIYLDEMIGFSIALGLAALLPASAQTAAVHAAHTPARLPAWALGPFKRFADINPIITPRPASVFSCPMRRRDIHWEKLHTFNPAAITVSDRIAVLYRAEDDTGQGIGGHTSRLGLWTSIDGTHSTERFSLPVLYPDNDIAKPFEWDGGCEDPRIVQAPDGTYVLTYVAWNRSKANICIATSRDLHIWKKHGPAFNSASPTDGEWTKSGAIVTTVVGGKILAARIKGKYWMYWEHDSEADPSIFLAVSEDLIHWTPVVEANGHPVPVLKTRKGSFDARLMDPGPPPLLTSAGIIFIYNGKNGDAHDGDQAYPLLSYSMGQVLFSADDPAHVIDRLQKPFLVPELPFERSGQYTNGTAFAEGLALKNGTWYLYYGSADSVIAVATWTPARDDLRGSAPRTFREAKP